MINVDSSLNKTIGELRLNDLYSELEELNYKEPVSLYYGYARFMSIVSCSEGVL